MGIVDNLGKIIDQNILISSLYQSDFLVISNSTLLNTFGFFNICIFNINLFNYGFAHNS